jgi:hypothetical protein
VNTMEGRRGGDFIRTTPVATWSQCILGDLIHNQPSKKSIYSFHCLTETLNILMEYIKTNALSM